MIPGHNPGQDELPDHPATGYGQTPAGPPQSVTRVHPAELVQVRRDLFWQNVVREILMGLAAAAAHETGRLAPTPTAAAASPDPVSDMFDGRMGVITAQGQRIPIADVIPVFACSTPGTTNDRMLSGDVQCTVFRIRTPLGEIYTLPITQIVGVHSMSQALADQLQQAAEAMEETDADGNKMPFGFGAYTSIARAESQGPTDSRSTPPEQAADA